MNTSDQLLEMLKTIHETETYLRKRCAAGQAGQSLALFEHLSGLLDLLDNRYRKSGYLPKERAPIFGQNSDILAVVNFLDDVDAWTGRVRDRVHRRKVRQELARGTLLEAVASEGHPFAQQAVELSQMTKPQQTAAPVSPAPVGTPQERVERDKGVSVEFSASARQAAQAAYQETPPVPKENHSSEKAAPAPAATLDPAQEGERLFAGVRARTGRTPRTSVRERAAEFPSDASAMEGGAIEEAAKPMGKAVAESGARPMGSAATESSTRQMGSAAPESGARQMGSAAPESGARPMGSAAPESGAKPMGSTAPESGAKPMGSTAREDRARPMSSAAPEGGAKPMGGAAPAQPKAMETTTTPAVGRGIAVDREFLRIFNELGNSSAEAIEKKLIQGFSGLENRYKMVMCDHVRRFSLLGTMEPDRNEFSLLKRRAEELVTHRDEYSWLYGKLGDYRSRETLLALLDNWYSFNFKRLTNVKDKFFNMYLDADLLRCTEDELFVDAGAGVGEACTAFSEFAGRWKRIYCYEPCARNIPALKKAASKIALTQIRQTAISDRSGQQLLTWSDDPLTSRLGEEGEAVDTVTLDEDIEGEIGILKLCLEGGEQAAIRGASSHIHKDHPRIAMRADHGDSDLWQLPRMIERLDKRYRFFLRHYGGNIVPAEYVLYAI